MSAHRAVVVLDGTPRTIVAVARSLHGRDIPVVAAQLECSGLGLGSNALRADVALSAHEDRFFAELRELLIRYGAGTVMPCSDRALELLLPHYDEVRRLAHLVPDGAAAIRRVLSKRDGLAAAQECGVRVPATYSLDALERGFGALRFPLIAKPAGGQARSDFKVKYFGAQAELTRFLQDDTNAERLIFQEYVPGDGVGISTVARHGDPIALFAHRRLHEYPPDGGVGVLFESEPVDPELGRAAAALLRYLRWHGPAMVEFRHDKRTGHYAFMEINGRFWGSLPLAIRSGVDFPYIAWRVAHGYDVQKPQSYDFGVRVRWTSGELQRLADLATDRPLRQRLGLRWYDPYAQFARSFGAGTHSALFSLRDPRPELVDVASTALRVAASKAWRLALRTLPDSWAHRLVQLRVLDAPYRKRYLAQWLANGIRRQATARDRIAAANSVTLVCRANRIRSPLAAAILASEVAGNPKVRLHIRSAGTRASEKTAFDERASAAAETMGLTLSGVPQRLTPDLVATSDLIVVMDRVVEAEVLTLYPKAAPKVVFLEHEIADPDKGSPFEFARCVEQLAADVRAVAQCL